MMSRMPARGLWLVVLVASVGLVSAGTARADEVLLTDTKTKKDFGTLSVGYDGHLSFVHPTPMTIRLKNPYREQTAFVVRFEVTSNQYSNTDISRTFEHKIALDSLAEKVVRIDSKLGNRLKVSIHVGRKTVFSEKLEFTSLSGYTNRILVAHGKDERVKFTNFDSTRGHFLGACLDAELPESSPAYHAFNTVIVTGSDPKSWSPAQRDAVLAWVRLGGTIIFSKVTQRDLGVRGFFNSLPGEAKSRGADLRLPENGKAFRDQEPFYMQVETKRLGAGQVQLISADLVDYFRKAQRRGQNEVSTALQRATSEVGSSVRASFPRHFTWRNRTSGDSTAIVIMIGFFAIYTFSLPIISLIFRRKDRFRLGRAIVIVILTFVFLAPAAAVMIRNGPASARIYQVVEMQENGEFLETSEVHLISGGGRSYDVELTEAPGLRTFVPVGEVHRGRVRSGWGWQSYVEDQSLETSRYDIYDAVNGRVVIENLPIEAWERFSFFTMRTSTGTPLRVTARAIGTNSVMVSLTNTWNVALERAAFGFRENNGADRHILLSKRPILPGETINKRLTRIKASTSLISAIGTSSLRRANWNYWQNLSPKGSSRSWIVVRTRRTDMKVGGSGVNVVERHRVLFQPIKVAGGERNKAKVKGGYLGVAVSNRDTNGYGVRILRIVAGSPAERAGLQVGDIITHIEGSTVNSFASLSQELESHDPGESVTIRYMSAKNGRSNRRSRINVKLGRPPSPGK